MYVTVNENKLYYRKFGRGKPLLLIHGNGESHEIFDRIVPPLSRNYTVYAIDSRGCGKSDPKIGSLHSISYDIFADDVIAFIQTLHLKKPYYCGFSDGGIIGVLVASKAPDLLDKMIICGTNTSPDGIRPGWRCFFSLIARLNRNPITKLILTEPNITEEDLKKITIPTLVLAGSRDVVKRSDTEFIANTIPHSTLHILKKEGHMSYVMHSTKLLPYIQNFCKK